MRLTGCFVSTIALGDTIALNSDYATAEQRSLSLQLTTSEKHQLANDDLGKSAKEDVVQKLVMIAINEFISRRTIDEHGRKWPSVYERHKYEHR